jgi:5-methyltetrahydrofolate--homocysteine methyltransferase
VILIGELINTSRKVISDALDNRDAGIIQQIAREQTEAGAHYLDVNCGSKLDEEVDCMQWLVNTVQAAVATPLCIDSPNPQALAAGLALAKNGQAMINSITGEPERFAAVLPLVLKYKAKVIALCMSDSGMPDTADQRMQVVHSLHTGLTQAGVPEGDIYFDPLIKPVSVVSTAGVEVLDTIRLIRQQYPQVHFACGLSNVSFGLPRRSLLNRLFVVETMTLGMDGYILNPTDKDLMGFITAAQLLLGQDEFCGNYVTAYRQGLLD